MESSSSFWKIRSFLSWWHKVEWADDTKYWRFTVYNESYLTVFLCIIRSYTLKKYRFKKIFFLYATTEIFLINFFTRYLILDIYKLVLSSSKKISLKCHFRRFYFDGLNPHREFRLYRLPIFISLSPLVLCPFPSPPLSHMHSPHQICIRECNCGELIHVHMCMLRLFACSRSHANLAIGEARITKFDRCNTSHRLASEQFQKEL